MRITVLAGGVGGAKMVDGFAQALSPDQMAVIVNTGDDFEHLSLMISPDVDTVCYTLAGLANPETGWGRQEETWRTYQALVDLGGPDWFHLGDKDLALHLLRTERRREGGALSAITREICRSFGVSVPVFPMSDDPVRTIVHTAGGETLGFQEYFVHRHCQPRVTGFDFSGSEEAQPVPGALQVLANSDVVIIAPSNPWVSIDPILAVPGYREIIEEKPVVAISPLIGGKAVKGPAAKMYAEMDIRPSAAAVAEHYQTLLDGFVLDEQDADELEKIRRWRIIPLVTAILMKDRQDRLRLAREVLTFCETILKRSQ